MSRVRPGGSKRWSSRASGATEDYKTGVKNPRQGWEEATSKAEDTYKSGIQQSISEGRFGKGVKKAGNAKWQQKALAKGGDRYAGGILQGEADYASGISPYMSAIEAVTLPPRGPKGDPRNIERVKAINDALRKVKLGK